MKREFLNAVRDNRLAHIIVDVQTELCAKKHRGTAVTERTAELIDGFSADIRAAGVPTIWLYIYNKVSDKYSPEKYLGGFYKVQPHDSDYFVPKHYDSGFKATDLGSLLERLGIDTLLLTGFYTDLCVKATALDGLGKGYSVSVVRDLTFSSELGVAHKWAALDNMQSRGVDIVSSREVRHGFGIVFPDVQSVAVPENTLRF